MSNTIREGVAAVVVVDSIKPALYWRRYLQMLTGWSLGGFEVSESFCECEAAVYRTHLAS